MNSNNLLKLLNQNSNKGLNFNSQHLTKKKSIRGLGVNYSNKLKALQGNNILNLNISNIRQAYILKRWENSIKAILDRRTKIFQELLLLNKKKFNFLKNIGTLKTLRILKGFPIRGQRTHTNAKTARKYNKIN